MTKLKFCLLLAVAIGFCAPLTAAAAAAAAKTPISSADLPLEARNIDDSSGSQEDDLISTSYVLPNQIFNDGKPYYAGKDPISGQFDFNAKKPAGIEPAVNEVIDPKEKIVLSNSSPNIHDFLNLPVKYSSSKFVYPLVSSSYANLKYQGSNKNYITQKKPTSVEAKATQAPISYHSSNYYTVPTTKLMAVPPTAPGLSSGKPNKITTTTTSSTTTTTTTTRKPTTTTSTTTQTTTATPTTTSTNVPSSPKYTTSTRRPAPTGTATTSPTRTTTVSPTRKKFVPTKKYTPTTAAAVPTIPMRFPDEHHSSSSAPRPVPTTTTVFTTYHPTPQSSIFPTTSTSTTKVVPSTSRQPVVFTEGPTAPPSFSPIPNGARVPNLDPADVYQTLGQKNTEQRIEQKPSMSLADIFNSLADEESALASQNQGNQGFDAQGNLIQPIAPKKPSPFAMLGDNAQQRPHSTRPTFGTTAVPLGQQPQPYNSDQKLISGSQENYSNEYVSYQVQQPNVMQYRPVPPGTINNVVISPGQNSASFVLGSQQQVGTNAFGNVEKEPLFSKEPPVQYGTVINEDIGDLKRPGIAGPPLHASGAQFQQAAPTTSYQQAIPAHGNSNFHQNGNFAGAPTGPAQQFVQRPLATAGSNNGGYRGDEPPEAPSPYQQLPLVNSNMRPAHSTKKQQNQQNQQSQQQHQQQQSRPNGPQSNLSDGHPESPQASYQHGIPPPPPVPATAQQPQRQQEQAPENSLPQNAQQDTKELLVSTNIRFPAASEDRSEELPSGPVAAGPPAGPQVNGHAQPLSLQQIQNSNPVVFPKTQDEENKLNELPQYQGEVGNEDVQIQKHEVLTMNQHKQKLNYPQLPEHITPSQHMEPPPRFQPAVNGGEHAGEFNKRPQQQSNRPHGPPPPPQFAYNEYTRKPIPGIARPNANPNLPNILPQFRPNAKISSGHPPNSNFNQEPGNIRIPGGPPPKRPNNPSPQFSHRRQPLMQQKRYPMNRISEYPAGPPPPHSHHPAEANRRVYRLPPYGGQGVQYVDRMYPRRPLPPPHGIRPADNYAVERHSINSNSESYNTLPQQAALTSDRMAAFEEDDLVINDPPQPMTPSKDHKSFDDAKLEPVVTLQMLQSQKKPVSLQNDDTGSGEIQVPAIGGPAEQDEQDNFDIPATSQNGLYVVYPMKGQAGAAQDLNEPSESNDPLPAVAHVEPPSGSEYQNTPFSVVRDQPQEPILKNKKPLALSLQQQTKTQPPKDKFPYPIEKPDPSYTELHDGNRVPGVLIAPRIINGAYPSSGITEAPIAIAYTPTEPNVYRQQNSNAQKYSNVNLATSVISEIRHTDTQTEEGLLNNNDFDLRGQQFEKNFMAPFYPSVSLGSATSAPSNGWNILPSSSSSSSSSSAPLGNTFGLYEKNKINRADVAAESHAPDSEALEMTTTKSFELDSFQPELQGGFKPIYPPGYKIEDEEAGAGTGAAAGDSDGAPNEHMQSHESNNGHLPYALANRMDTSASRNAPSLNSTSTPSPMSTSSSSSAPITSTTTARPTHSSTVAAAEKSVASTTAKSPAGQMATTTTARPNAAPTQRKKSAFETSLEALLFGDDEDFEGDEEPRKNDMPKAEALTAPKPKAQSGPRSVPRMGPRNLKMS